MTAQPNITSLCERCGQEHPDCVVCSPTNPIGLQLQPDLQADGSVKAVFPCDVKSHGSTGILHGGITAALSLPLSKPDGLPLNLATVKQMQRS